MPGIEELERNIARLEKAQEETRAVVREAHEAIQTIRLLLSDIQAVRDSFALGIKKEVDEALARQVKAGLDKYGDTIKNATTEAHQHVIDEFGKLTNLMMYGNDKGKGVSIVDEWLQKMVATEVRKQVR